jgi:predicted RNA-binding protein associated with RNAse of E/G family
MFDPENWLAKEEDELTRQVNEGIISQATYQKAMREIHAEYRAMAQDAAQEAYDREMERW